MSGLAAPTATFRSGLWRSFAYFWLAFVIVIVADILRKHALGSSFGSLAWVALITSLVWCTSWRPLVRYDFEGVEIRNPLRTAKVPWNDVTRIDATDSLRVHTKDRTIRAWAVARSGAVATLVRGARRPASGGLGGPEQVALVELARRSPADYAVEVLREIWQRQQTTTKGTTSVTWAVPEIAAILILGAVVVIATAT